MKAAPLSYAQSLRVIGESLEVRGISAFDLEKEGENYMLRVIVSQPARAASFSKRIAQMVWRSHNSDREPSDLAVRAKFLHYTPSDISRLIIEQKSQHGGANVMADTHKLSQVLGVVGDHLDRKEGSAFTVSMSGHSLSALMKPEMIIKYTKVSPRKIYMITPSTCTCAGRNALRASLNQHAKNLYPEKLGARLFLSKGTGSFSHNHVCSHPRFIFLGETGDGDCDA
jgi:hypothetical protein